MYQTKGECVARVCTCRVHGKNVCVCACPCACVCVHALVCSRLCTCACVHMHSCVCLLVCVCVCVCVCEEVNPLWFSPQSVCEELEGCGSTLRDLKEAHERFGEQNPLLLTHLRSSIGRLAHTHRRD